MKKFDRRRFNRRTFKRLFLFHGYSIFLRNRIFDRNSCNTLFQFVYS